MGSKVTAILLVFMLLICFFIIALKAQPMSKIFNESELSDFLKNKYENFNYPSDIWSPKNFLDDLSLKTNAKEEFVPGEIIVKFKEETVKNFAFDFSDNLPSLDISSLDLSNEKYDLMGVEKISKINPSTVLENVYKFSYPKDIDVLSVVKSYEDTPFVEYAEPNYIYHTYVSPDDPYFDQQWALNQLDDHDIDAPEAWNIETGDENIVIAIADTGVDYTHPDLAGNIWINTDEILDGVDNDGNGYIDDIIGWDFENKDNDPIDDYGHGTHCSGIASAVTNNGVGIAGVCWNCTIMPIKIGGAFGLSEDDAANGIIYAANNGADVISMSWGGSFHSGLIEDALDYAYSKGVILVSAAGNSGTNIKSYPAAYENVIAVAATDENDEKAYFSNWGSWVDIAAPGVDIYSTMPTYEVFMNYFGFSKNYDNCSGTSMACPYVAGLCGLILSKNPSLNQEEVRTILKSSTDNVVSDYYIGIGRISAYQAVLRDGTTTAILNSSISNNDLVGVVSITGTANGSIFTNYSVYYGSGLYPGDWTEIASSLLKVNDSILAEWNTTLVDDGIYTLRLMVNDSNGFYGEDRLQVEVNNVTSTLYADDDNTIGPWNGTAEYPYQYIQDAIDNAGHGDTIYVYNGTYYENLMINDNLNLIGEDYNTTIIHGSYYYDYGILVNAEQCNISNFTLENIMLGIIYTSCENSVVQNNYINDSEYGIYLISTPGEYSFNNSNISGNNIFNNRVENNIVNNSMAGIVYIGDYTLVCNNTIDSGLIGIAGWGNNNTIQDNTVTNQLMAGLYLYRHVDGCIKNNSVYNNYLYGIQLLSDSPNNVIMGNTIAGSVAGIYIGDNSDNTVISGNALTGNQMGIYVYGEAEVSGYFVDTIYTDSFEDGDASGWSIYDLSGPGYTWDVESDVPYWADLTYQDGSYFLLMDDDDAPPEANNTDSAVTPLIDCSNYSDVYLKFAVDFKAIGPYGEFWVNVSNDSGATWTNVWDETNDNDTMVLLNISSIADEEQILVNFTYDDGDEWGWGAVIDNVVIGSSHQTTTVYDNDNTSIAYNNIYNNTEFGVWYDTSEACFINATLNWWGDETGPYNADSNPVGLGDTVSGVNYYPWLFHMYPGVENLNTGETYSLIQNAIDNASNGDIIIIYDGTYYENAIIDESITLQAASSPVIDGNGGIGLSIEANNTIVKELSVTNCSTGVKVYNDSFIVNNVTLFCNNIYNNFNGICLNDSSNNTVYHNNFISNTNQAYDNSSNVWYNTTILNGNYWDDCDGIDANNNGIGDTPYNISGGNNTDQYPLMYQFENYYILSIVVSSQVNENTQFTVTIKSNGGTTIQGASVTFNGVTKTTSSNGQVTFTAPSVNTDASYSITTTKTGYAGASSTITVKNVDTGGPGPGPGGPSGGDTTSPTTPTNVRCTTPATDNTPSFAWNASTDSSSIAGYYVKIDSGTDTWIVGNVLTWTSTNAIADGTHTFYVKAKDASTGGNNGTYGSCSFTINTTTVGNKPVTDANGPYVGLTYQNINFDGSKSYDTDGRIVNYTWNLDDGTVAYGKKVTHSYNKSGLYTITLTTTDDEGLADTNTTTVNITLDSDGDGWSDADEGKYNTNKNDPNDYPVDTDGDKLPDDYDEDDDNDGLVDHLEKTLGSNSTDKSDVIIIMMEGDNNIYYLIDSNKDGKSDKLYSSIGRITTVSMTDDGKYLLDIDGDSKWDYTYDPASKEVTPYEEKTSKEFPWLLAIIGIIIAIVVIIAILYFTGYIHVEKEYIIEQPSEEQKPKEQQFDNFKN